MTTTTALIWKEWRELRWFLFAGLAVFTGPPLLYAAAAYLRWNNGVFRSDAGDGLVLAFGGLLAVFVAVGATCRDLGGGIQAFWQSRPIRPWRWLITKYAVGLAVTLVACSVPIVIQSGAEHSLLTCHSFTLLLIYSVSFLLGCLIRQSAQAAILSCGAALIIYFLPVIVPPLGWLSFIVVQNDIHRANLYGSAYWSFVAAMGAGSVGCVVLAWLAVQRDWRLRMDQRLMFWTLGGVALLLFAGFAFQLASNLECEREIPLPPVPPDEISWLAAIAAEGDQGIAAICRQPRKPGFSHGALLSLRRFDRTDPAFFVGNEVQISGGLSNFFVIYNLQILRSPGRSEQVYLLTDDRVADSGSIWGTRKALYLCTVSLDDPPSGPILHRLDLVPHLPELHGTHIPRMCLYGDRIYIAGPRQLLIVSLEDPGAPAVEGIVPGPRPYLLAQPELVRGKPVFRVTLMPVPGLGPRDRLELFMKLALSGKAFAWQDDLLVVDDRQGLATFRLVNLDADTAEFEQAGRRDATPLERLVVVPFEPVVIRNGLAYVREARLGVGLTVYDVRRADHPQRVGHYTARGQSLGVGAGDVLAPLADGRMLLGGTACHILAPPRLND